MIIRLTIRRTQLMVGSCLAPCLLCLHSTNILSVINSKTGNFQDEFAESNWSFTGKITLLIYKDFWVLATCYIPMLCLLSALLMGIIYLADSGRFSYPSLIVLQFMTSLHRERHAVSTF